MQGKSFRLSLPASRRSASFTWPVKAQ